MSEPLLRAPFTPSQVRAIEAWQKAGSVHPLTCETSEHGPLMVGLTGLFCRTCDYTQDWVPAVCAETFPSDYAPPLVQQAVDGIAELIAKQNADRVVALTIAIKLMEMHLELATPGGEGRDTIAWTVAQGRLTTLRGLLEEIRATQPAQQED